MRGTGRGAAARARGRPVVRRPAAAVGRGRRRSSRRPGPAKRSTASVRLACGELGARDCLGVRLRGGEQLQLVRVLARARACAPWPAGAPRGGALRRAGRPSGRSAPPACRCASACRCGASWRRRRGGSGWLSRRRRNRRGIVGRGHGRGRGVGGARAAGSGEGQADAGEERAAGQAKRHASRSTGPSPRHHPCGGYLNAMESRARRLRRRGSEHRRAVAHEAHDQECLGRSEQREQRELPGRRGSLVRRQRVAGGHQASGVGRAAARAADDVRLVAAASVGRERRSTDRPVAPVPVVADVRRSSPPADARRRRGVDGGLAGGGGGGGRAPWRAEAWRRRGGGAVVAAASRSASDRPAATAGSASSTRTASRIGAGCANRISAMIRQVAPGRKGRGRRRPVRV